MELSPPVVMGVVNVTPDSFSDGGLYLDVDAAVQHGEELVSDGAAIVDVGGESTRPGAAPVEAAGGGGGGGRPAPAPLRSRRRRSSSASCPLWSGSRRAGPPCRSTRARRPW